MTNRRLILLLGLAFLAIGMLTISASWYAIGRIERDLLEVQEFRNEHLAAVLAMDATINEAMQESLAYVLSGRVQERHEFHLQEKEFAVRGATYESLMRASGASESADLARFFGVMQTSSSLFAQAREIFAEYEAGGAVSAESFEQYEILMDRIGAQFTDLVEYERGQVLAAQEQTLYVIEDSRRLFMAQGLLVLGVALLSAVIAARVLRRALTDRQATLAELSLQKQALEFAEVGILFVDAQQGDMPLIYANPAFSAITGYPLAEIIGRNCRFLQGELTDRDEVGKIRRAIERGESVRSVLQNYTKDGTPFWNEISITPIRDQAGTLTHFVGAMNDASDKIVLENQTRQSQKMEAIGRLAGGIAHDFNNYLTVISGATEMLMLGKGEKLESWAGQIADACQRAAALTGQLLAFARRQVLHPQVLNLSEVVQSIEPLLRRTIGEDIILETQLDASAGMISVDRSQLEQVITNLVLNARDAMPDGGRLRIATGSMQIDSDYVGAHPGVGEGPHTLLTVADTGSGIQEQLIDKIFDPFVTTKDPSSGTGLGLATVYGIIKQSGGAIEVDSRPGEGTEFRIVFPCVDSYPEAKAEETQAPPFRGHGRVLLVEDDDMVRPVARAMLEECGFEVLEAEQGLAALNILKQETDIRLLISDVIMPGMGGFELADLARQTHPEIGILFISGYRGLSPPSGQDQLILQKPFTAADLGAKLAEILDPKTGHEPGGEQTAV